MVKPLHKLKLKEIKELVGFHLQLRMSSCGYGNAQGHYIWPKHTVQQIHEAAESYIEDFDNYTLSQINFQVWLPRTGLKQTRKGIRRVVFIDYLNVCPKITYFEILEFLWFYNKKFIFMKRRRDKFTELKQKLVLIPPTETCRYYIISKFITTNKRINYRYDFDKEGILVDTLNVLNVKLDLKTELAELNKKYLAEKKSVETENLRAVKLEEYVWLTKKIKR